jgi:hypothetical protein
VAGPQDGIVGTADATIRLGTLPAWRMREWRTSSAWAARCMDDLVGEGGP